jgi:hypothetical protein
LLVVVGVAQSDTHRPERACGQSRHGRRLLTPSRCGLASSGCSRTSCRPSLGARSRRSPPGGSRRQAASAFDGARAAERVGAVCAGLAVLRVSACRSWGTVEALQLVGDRVWRPGGRVALGRVLDEVLLRPERDLLERGQQRLAAVGFERSPADSQWPPVAAPSHAQSPANRRKPAQEAEGEGFEPSSEENPPKRFSRQSPQRSRLWRCAA